MSRPMTLINKSGTVTSGGTAQTIAAALPGRAYFLLQNHSDTDCWIDFGATAVAGQPSIKVAAGTTFEMTGEVVSNQAVSLIGATTGKAFTAKEA